MMTISWHNKSNVFCYNTKINFQNITIHFHAVVFFSLKAMRAEVWRARTESPLFDCKKYAQGMEKLYRIMWNRHANNEKPDHISAQNID